MAKTRYHSVSTPNNMIQMSSKMDTKIDVLWSTYHQPCQYRCTRLLTLLTTSTCQTCQYREIHEIAKIDKIGTSRKSCFSRFSAIQEKRHQNDMIPKYWKYPKWRYPKYMDATIYHHKCTTSTRIPCTSYVVIACIQSNYLCRYYGRYAFYLECTMYELFIIVHLWLCIYIIVYGIIMSRNMMKSCTISAQSPIPQISPK